MWKKLKKIHNLFSKKSVVLLLVCVVGFGLFAPIISTQVAQAQEEAPPFWTFIVPFGPALWQANEQFDFLGKVGTPVFNAFLTAFFMLLMSIGTVFLEASGWLLSWVISPDFITLKFTDNIFVNEAWRIVRDFVNMFFILILVIIGLSTALRIKEYEAQKTLPLLIGMALLINFTPMICGLFIDISNIIMNFFLDGVGIGLGRGVEQLLISWSKFAGMISETSPAAVAGYGFSMALFTFITAFVYLIFAFLFIIRYLALWILVILSPLAFFAYILPATRGAWTMWWKQFTQWCIVGIGGAFFLYLAEVMNVQLADVTIAPPASAGNPEMNMITAFFPFLIPIVFLIIGVFATLSTSAIGATQGISIVTKGGKLAGGKMMGAARGTETGQRVEKWARKTGEKIPIIGPKPGTYELEKEKERKKLREAAGAMPKDVREKRAKAFGVSHEEKLSYQQIRVEKGEASDTEEKRFIADAESQRFNVKETLEHRPDLAGDPQKAQGRTKIREQVRKETPIDFVKETDKKALGKLDVVLSMDKAKIERMSKFGKSEQKEAVYNTLHSTEMTLRVNKLAREATQKIAGAQQELDRIVEIKTKIKKDPNFA